MENLSEVQLGIMLIRQYPSQHANQRDQSRGSDKMGMALLMKPGVSRLGPKESSSNPDRGGQAAHLNKKEMLAICCFLREAEPSKVW